jgi:hypothetical protein
MYTYLFETTRIYLLSELVGVLCFCIRWRYCASFAYLQLGGSKVQQHHRGEHAVMYSYVFEIFKDI